MAPNVNESNPLAALGPIVWDNVDHDSLGDFLSNTFAAAQLIADSIPAASTSSFSYTSNGGRPRSHTDGAVSYGRHPNSPAHPTAPDTVNNGASVTLEEKAALIASEEKEKEKIRQDLRQSWKEVHAGGANPREIVVYKMNGGRDGYAGSSWFARRSIHRIEKAKPTGKGKDTNTGPDVPIGFDMFRKALLKEFAIHGQDDDTQTDTNDIEVKGAKGKNSEATSTVRTMITKKRIEHVVVEGNGNDVEPKKAEEEKVKDPINTRQLDVYLLEAIFPGPTAARDFVTMLLTAESPCTLQDAAASSTGQHGLRQFMLVSKPCEHPATPNRQGYVRAQYESVEMIREVRVPVVPSAKSGKLSPAENNRKTRSSINLSHAHLDGGSHIDFEEDTHETAIEWLMITRNNPGGSVPRFLVDKSTPSSIISDANKFMDWLVAHEVEARAKNKSEEAQTTGVSKVKPSIKTVDNVIPEEDEEEQRDPKQNGVDSVDLPAEDGHDGRNPSSSPPVTILSMEGSGGAASSTKLFNMFAGAFGGAGTAVASKLPNPFGGAVEMIHSSFEAQQQYVDEEDDSGGDTYSDIDEEDEVGDESVRGRSRGLTQNGPDAQDVDNKEPKQSAPSIRSTASSSVASIAPPPPPPSTALEILAHSRAAALGRLNDPVSAGQSTGGSSLGSITDTENDTETGRTTDAKRKHAEQAAAKAAKVAKAAEAAQKKHERELKKLQDRQRKAEDDLIKAANKNKSKKGDAEPEKEKVDEAEAVSGVDSSAKGIAEKAGDGNLSSSSLSTDAQSSTIAATRTEIQKLREKHDKAVARQEAQYQKEMEKLEKKRQQQAEKEAARLRKQQERDEKSDTTKQLAHARAERDVARKETEVLAERVRQLEAENRLLAVEVAKLKGDSSLLETDVY
ncbi:hypothetical protein SEUCBS140593_010475 [Sporothrix eucalyptigena]|uniref:DUF3074 domain-containing protein n=1 Tax=Sporothrix eucalyptigena TaxID=1812306 RepID=A0ABP0D1F9_9PEZI